MEELKLIPEKNNIRIKEQEGKYVIFNLETSGFHMLEKDAIDILGRVDGKTTIKELANFFSNERNLPIEGLEKDFIEFFKGLELRKIVTLKTN